MQPNKAKSARMASCMAHPFYRDAVQLIAPSLKTIEAQNARVLSFVGVDKSFWGPWNWAEKNNVPRMYMDNGYFGPSKVYFRATFNCLQHQGGDPATPARYEAIGGPKIEGFKRGGRNILVLTQTAEWHRLFS